MPASYRRDVEYDRKRTSRVNPPVEDSECDDCGGPLDADGFCIQESMDAARFEEMAHGADRVEFFDDTEPSDISLPDHADWY